jgi:hypothetical protein
MLTTVSHSVNINKNADPSYPSLRSVTNLVLDCICSVDSHHIPESFVLLLVPYLRCGS